MAVKLGDAVLYLQADSRDLDRGLDTAGRKVKGLGSIFQGLAMGAGLGAFNAIAGAVTGAVDQMGQAISSASDLNETLSKVQTLFGEGAGPLVTWAEGAAVAMGLSKQAALDAAGSLGNMFLQLGAGTDTAATTAQSMTQLAADLASFHNVAGGTPEVLDAMQSAFRGEYDALQRYIPTINAAAVQQEALAQTGKTSAKELTDLEKATAAQTLMMRDAGAAVGDYARTADGLANSQRTLDANMANLRATIGDALLPAMTALTSWANDFVTAVMPGLTAFITNTLIPGLTAFGEAMRKLWAEYGDDLIAGLSRTWDVIRAGLELATNTMATISELWRLAQAGRWREFGEKLRAIWEPISEGLADALDRMSEGLAAWLDATAATLQERAPDSWGEAGSMLAQGLIDGFIRTMTGRGLDQLRSEMAAMLEVIRGFWGIQSPSRRAAQEIGAPIAAGIVEGLQSELSRVRLGLGGLVGGAVPTAAPAAATWGPVNVTINVAGDAGAGAAARDGLLSAMRQIGAI